MAHKDNTQIKTADTFFRLNFMQKQQLERNIMAHTNQFNFQIFNSARQLSHIEAAPVLSFPVAHYIQMATSKKGHYGTCEQHSGQK